MDNLPKDPPDGNKQSLPSDEVKTPPPFGDGFDPHVNPPDPNNPYQTSPQPSPNIPNSPNLPNLSETDSSLTSTYSEVAQHKLRDSHGRFATDHIPSDPQTTLNSPNTLKNIISWLIIIFLIPHLS